MHSRGAFKKLNVEFRIWDQQKNEHPTSNIESEKMMNNIGGSWGLRRWFEEMNW